MTFRSSASLVLWQGQDKKLLDGEAESQGGNAEW